MNMIPILIAIAIVIAACAAIAFVAILQRKKLSRTLQVEIRNLGNVTGGYELQAQDPHSPPALRFQFTLNDTELAPAPVGQSEIASVAPPPIVRPETASVAPSAPAPSGSGDGASKAEQAMESGGIIINILTLLGSILPRSLGAPLTQTASQMRRGQTTASRVKQIKGQTSRLAPGGKKGRGVASAPPSAPSPGATRESPDREASRLSRPQGVGAERVDQREWEEPWAQTPSVEPGEALTVDLTIRPAQSHRGQTYPFTVISRANGLPDRVQPNRAEVQGSVKFSGGSRFTQLLPYLAIVAIAILLLAVTFLVAYGTF
jgi:hypothetical protein